MTPVPWLALALAAGALLVELVALAWVWKNRSK